MDHARDNSPDAEISLIGNCNRWVVGVGCNQLAGRTVLNESFHRQFAIDDGNYDFSTGRLKGTINDQNISVVYSGILHGFTGYPYKEGGYRMRDQQLIQVKMLIYMVFSR